MVWEDKGVQKSLTKEDFTEAVTPELSFGRKWKWNLVMRRG